MKLKNLFAPPQEDDSVERFSSMTDGLWSLFQMNPEGEYALSIHGGWATITTTDTAGQNVAFKKKLIVTADDACGSNEPGRMCRGCNCWKLTRENCS